VPSEAEIDPGLFMPIDFAPGPSRIEVVDEDEAPIDGHEAAVWRAYETEEADAFTRTSETSGVRRVFSVRGSRAQSEAWKRRTLQKLAAPVDYQVKYVLPKGRVPEVQPGVGSDGVTMETSVTAEYKLSAYRAMPISRATENGIYVVMCNAPADPNGLNRSGSSHGQSKVIHPDGNVLVEADIFSEELVIQDLDLDAASRGIALRALNDVTCLNTWMHDGLKLVSHIAPPRKRRSRKG